MPKNPPKQKGSTGPCWKCGTAITYNEKEYNGTITLQWQGVDNSAHYKKVGDEFVCKTTFNPQASTPTIAQQLTDNTVNWIPISDDDKSEDMRELVIGLKTMRSLAYGDAKDMHPDMNEHSNTFGQIVNAGIGHLIELAKVKAIKEKKK
jgi:hypothetical protein